MGLYMDLAIYRQTDPRISLFNKQVEILPLHNTILQYRNENDTFINKKTENLCNDLKLSLLEQGFILKENEKLDIIKKTKNDFRKVQVSAKIKLLNENPNYIKRQLKIIKKYAKNGKEINPEKIKLEIRQVKSGSEEELIFRWWNLTWWSMPYQRPYGRQMRFIIWDTEHDAPFGLISLQSPILKQAVRDRNLQIPNDELDYWVNRSMYAQRVGALPPYNYLIGGKMVALSLVSKEIQNAYYEKYKDKFTIMNERNIEPELLFITTTSAFGRSSIYNRLKYEKVTIAEKLGYTEGYGSFQIPNELYNRLIEYLNSIGENTIRGYGGGPSKKLKLISLACRKLGLANYSFHGIKREYFLFSLVNNLKEVIKRKAVADWKNYSFNDLFIYWKERWLWKRAINTNMWREFKFEDYERDVLNLIEEKR